MLVKKELVCAQTRRPGARAAIEGSGDNGAGGALSAAA